MFKDIHEGEGEEDQERRIGGLTSDEVLYADDTIVFSTDNNTLEKSLHKIEECAKPYGLKLNHAKCELICTDSAHMNKQKEV